MEREGRAGFFKLLPAENSSPECCECEMITNDHAAVTTASVLFIK